LTNGNLLEICEITRNCFILILREGTTIGYDRADDERRGLKTQPIAGSSDYVVVVPRNAVL
jgi:hypothetical protein